MRQAAMTEIEKAKERKHVDYMRDLIKAQMLRERTYVVFYVNTEKHGKVFEKNLNP